MTNLNIDSKLVEDFTSDEKNYLAYWLSSLETYSPNKIKSLCLLAGTSEMVANEIVGEIAIHVDDGTKMSEIRPLIFALLQKYDSDAAKRFKASDLYVRTSNQNFERFNKNKIVSSLVRETGLTEELSDEIADEVESFIRTLRLDFLSSPLVREIVVFKLLERRLEGARRMYTRLGTPIYDVEQMINKGVSTDIKRENANLQHTPETINWIISGEALEQYAMLKLVPPHIANSHLSGDFHIHILSNLATRPNCIQHYMPLFFKHGLKVDGTGQHTSIAKPAGHIAVAIQHCAKVLLSSQTQMAGGQSIDAFNVWLAPFVRGLSDKEIRQAAQEFIYELNMSYVARGGQVVFSNVDFELTIPNWLKDVPAIGPKGKEIGVYGDYEEEARKFLTEYVKLKLEGDAMGKQHMWPNDVFKVRPEVLKGSEYDEELMLIHDYIAKFGTPYIANLLPEWQTENANYMGCLSSDTMLPYVNDSHNHLSSIKDLAEKYFKKFGEKKYGVSVYTEPENLYVWSWNKDKNKIEKKRVLKIIKNPPADTLRIKTTKGKQIEVTKDHPFYRISRGSYWLNKSEEVKAGALAKDDRILVPKQLPSVNFDGKIDALSELIGFFVGDGTIQNYGKSTPVIQFNFRADSDHLTYLVDLCGRLGVKLEVNKTYHSRDKVNYVNCYIRDKKLCKLFSEEAYENKQKHVPERVLESSATMIGFLAGLINSDGYVRVVKASKTKTTETLVTTTSKEVFDNLIFILSSLGLDYSLRKQKNPGKKCKKLAYRVSLFGRNAEWVLSKIPLASRHKKKEFKVIGLNDKHVKSVKIKDIVDVKAKDFVYDLEVEDNHTFVSGEGMFIHSNCRTRLDSNFAGPWGTLRTGNDLYITLNLPRIAYQARGNDDKFFELMDERLKKMADMLIVKHNISDRILNNQNLLPFLGQRFDGESYYQLNNTTETLGYAGLTEAVKFHTDSHLHEAAEAQNFGHSVIKYIRDYANDMTKNTGLRFSVIASPAETCAARLSKLDIAKFGSKNVVISGTEKDPYYTNSHMVKMDAEVPLSEKIGIEQAYHPLTNGGHIFHIWLGEQSPSAEALLDLTKKICQKTDIGFFAYTKDFTVCNVCNNFSYGLKNVCPKCQSPNVTGYSRITGYYQAVQNFNPSKKQELKDRYRYSNPEM